MTTLSFRTQSISKFFLFIYLFYTLGAAAVVFISGEDTNRNNTIFVYSWLAVHFFSILLFFLTVNRQSVKVCTLLLLLSAYFFAVSFRASETLNSIVYSSMLSLNIMSSVFISKYISAERFVLLVKNFIIISMFLAMIGFLLGYDKVIHDDHHKRLNLLGMEPLRGFFAHKVMGSLFANVGLIMSFLVSKGVRRWIEISICIFFIILSGSSTGLFFIPMSFLIIFLLGTLIKMRISSSLFVLMTVVLVMLVAYFSFLILPFLATLLERDITLTGRTYLWEWGLQAWLEKPFFGWGLHGYLDSYHYTSIKLNYDSFSNYDVPHFHNSLIQTLVDFGIFGAIALFLFVTSPILFLYKSLLNNWSRYDFSLLVVICIFLIASVSMHLFFNYNHFATFFVSFVFFYSLQLKENNRTLRSARLLRGVN